MKYNIRLDVCTICNLNCTACYMRNKKAYRDGIGINYLKFETFKKFIDDNKEYIGEIEISNNGEALINPDIIPILRYAHENNIRIRCENGTNLSFKNDELLKTLTDCEVIGLTVSCDGVTQESYSKYRVGGDINVVFDNIKKIQDYKKLKNSPFPNVYWQYILRESTEDEVELAIEKAKELGVNITFKLTWEKDYTPDESKVQKLKELTGLKNLTRNTFKQNTGKVYCPNGMPTCKQLWEQPAINWDGRLMGCCTNKYPLDINVFEIGLVEALNHPIYTSIKEYLLGITDELNVKCSCSNCAKGQSFRLFADKYRNALNITNGTDLWK